MAGILNPWNWRNLVFGKGSKDGGKGKAGDGGIWAGDGSPNLAFSDLSNRTKVLCKAHEKYLDDQKKAADKLERDKEVQD